MNSLRVMIASPDQALSAGVVAIVAGTGHEVVLQCATPFDALEAALEDRVDVAILDEGLRSVHGSEVAAVLRDLHSRVSTIVLHRGELTADEGLVTLDALDEQFPEALTTVLERTGDRRDRGFG